MLQCLYPRSLVVYPTGSRLKKDGTLGKLTTFDINRAQNAQNAQLRAGEIPTSYVVPCGKCINCRRNKAFQWSRRLLMESSEYNEEDMCFLTLTYDENTLPADGLLCPEHLSSFLKRLRETLRRRDPGVSLRYFASCEYGDQFQRPHYHLILFGYNFFGDAKLSHYTEDREPLFTHPFITNAWSDKGYALFGFVSPASINYVAGYVVKKFRKSSDKAVPPFIRMSTKPGIGNKFLLAQSDNIQRDGGFYLRGKFFKLDSDSVRFLVRQNVLSDDDVLVRRLRNEWYSRLLSYLSPDPDPLEAAKVAARKYAFDNRLLSALPR